MKEWNEFQDEMLIDIYPNTSIGFKKISKILNHTIPNIKKRAQDLCLERNDDVTYTYDTIKIIKRVYPNPKVPLEDIIALTGLSLDDIGVIARFYNLKRGKMPRKKRILETEIKNIIKEQFVQKGESDNGK